MPSTIPEIDWSV